MTCPVDAPTALVSRWWRVVLAVTLIAGGVALDGGAASAATSWTQYHAEPSRVGVERTAGSLDPVTTAWTAGLGAAVYGQPLVADGRVFAATEDDRVVALNARTGRVLWSRTIGAPLTNVDEVAGCGDIDPLGITSTPAIDLATRTIYVVGEVSTGPATVRHELVGMSILTGRVTVSDDVDPPLPDGESALHLLQRPGLVVSRGRVYISFGGNYGDCGAYHGWVVAVRTTGTPELRSFEVASDGEGGAVWQGGGAPAFSPASGDLYVTTGNANPDPPEGGPDPKLYTESVVKLSPNLTVLASYKDEVAGGDEDLSTSNPVLLPDGDLFAVGKTDIGYVLRQSDLSVVGSIPGICGSDPAGGPAFDVSRDTLFVACHDGGIQPVDLATNRLGTKLIGANSPPIVIGSDLWAAQSPTGTLSEYDATTDARLQEVQVGSIPTFASPSAADGLVLIGTTTGVTALTGPRTSNG